LVIMLGKEYERAKKNNCRRTVPSQKQAACGEGGKKANQEVRK